MALLLRRYLLIFLVVALPLVFFRPDLSRLAGVHFQGAPGALSPAHLRLINAQAGTLTDALRNDTNYITSWGSNVDWANDVLSSANLIYFGYMTGRVPVVPTFLLPLADGAAYESTAFSEMFDLPRFEAATDLRVLEWHHIKDSQSEDVDEMGCWSVPGFLQNSPRSSIGWDRLKLDISYTSVPPWTRLLPESPDSPANLWSLARVSFPEQRVSDIGHAQPSPLHGMRRDPDEHFLCFDDLAYAAVAPHTLAPPLPHSPQAGLAIEIAQDYSPVWRDVLKHLRWSPRVERQAEEHVRRAFGFGDKAPLPQYVAVHIPRCGATQCVPPVSELERLVSSIYASLIASQTLTGPSLVFVLSESPLPPAWRAAASALAWIILDAASPPVDAAVLSGAIGYVGVLGAGAVQEVGVAMAARRVREWRGGVVRMHQLEGASAEFA